MNQPPFHPPHTPTDRKMGDLNGCRNGLDFAHALHRNIARTITMATGNWQLTLMPVKVLPVLVLRTDPRIQENQGVSLQQQIIEHVLQAKLDGDANQTTSNPRLPTICLSDDEMQELPETSLRMQQEIMPDDADGIREAWKHLNKKKYCEVDTATLLMQEDWIEFFDGLPGWLNIRPRQR